MTPQGLIAGRYLRSNHSFGFISLIGYLGIIGLAVGITALVLTMSIMSGFQSAVEEKVASMDGHLRLSTMLGDDAAIPDSIFGLIKAHPEVVAVTPFVARHALIRQKKLSDGVLLMGANLDDLRTSVNLEQFIVAGAYPGQDQDTPLILGEKLALTLHVQPGDAVHIFDLRYMLEDQGIRGERFTVAAIYRSGMVEYDQLLAFTSYAAAARLFGLGDEASQAIITLKDLQKTDVVAADLEATLGFPYYTMSWRARHARLFAWLTGQQMPVFIIFAFIAIVALINIVSTLVLITIEKYRDIGILRSIGFSKGQIRGIFLRQGSLVGLIGACTGLLAALLFGTLQQRYGFLSLDADIYFMKSLPVMWTWQAVIGIPLAGLLATVMVSWLPAAKAANIQPAEALRYE